MRIQKQNGQVMLLSNSLPKLGSNTEWTGYGGTGGCQREGSTGWPGGEEGDTVAGL